MSGLNLTIIIGSIVAIAAGIVITHVLLLVADFLPHSRGYMLRGSRKIWRFLLKSLAVEFLVGLIFLSILAMVVSYAPYLYVLSFHVGVAAAAASSTFEQLILPKRRTSVARLEKPLTRMVLKYHLALRHSFAWGIESCRQQDVFDCQKSGWDLGLTTTEISRRIRILYEIKKSEIAKLRKDNTLLAYDVNHNPWEKFYLLVRHIGRRKLRQYIRNPPASPFWGWSGTERRRMRGSWEDRQSLPEHGSSSQRIYDSAGGLALSKPRPELLHQEEILSADATTPVERMRERYAELIDKQFAAKLSSDDQRELARLEALLEKAEAPLYEEAIKRLEQTCDELSTNSSRQ